MKLFDNIYANSASQNTLRQPGCPPTAAWCCVTPKRLVEDGLNLVYETLFRNCTNDLIDLLAALEEK